MSNIAIQSPNCISSPDSNNTCSRAAASLPACVLDKERNKASPTLPPSDVSVCCLNKSHASFGELNISSNFLWTNDLSSSIST